MLPLKNCFYTLSCRFFPRNAYVGGATLSFEGSLVVFLHEVLRVDRLTGVKPTLGFSGKLKDKQSELFCCCGTEFDI